MIAVLWLLSVVSKKMCSIISKKVDELTERIIYRNEQEIACLAWSEPFNVMVFSLGDSAPVIGSL